MQEPILESNQFNCAYMVAIIDGAGEHAAGVELYTGLASRHPVSGLGNKRTREQDNK